MAQPLNGPSAREMQSVETLSYVLMLLSIISCGLVLFAYATVACQGPESRKRLDRVSFRLLVETLVCNLIYGIALMLSYKAADGSAGCGLGAFILNLGCMLGIFLTACISVNSQLVLIHGFNGKVLEKFYVTVSAVLAVILCASAYGFGQLGWNDAMDWCWFNNPDKSARVHWMIGSQSVWVALASVVEIVSSSCVILWLCRSKSTIFSLFRRAPEMGGCVSSPSTSIAVMLVRDPKYRRIIIRIALYPIVSIVFNLVGLSMDLHMAVTSVDSEQEFRLFVFYIVLVGGRNIVYSALASADPSFVAAVRDLRGEQSFLSTRGFRLIASELLNGVVSGLNLEETSPTRSGSNDVTETSYSTTRPAAEEGAALSLECPLEREKDEFQILKAQL